MIYEIRKVQEIGNSLYIALPKEWVRKLKLKKGSLVRLSIDPRGALIVTPIDIELEKSSEIILDVSRFPNLTRAIVRSYLLGYDIIRVYSRNGITLEHKDAARKACSILLGLGVIDERKDMLTLQVFTTTRIELEELIYKVNTIAISMYTDLYNTLKKPLKEMLHSIISRDETLDKLYFYGVRVIRGYMKSYHPKISSIKLLTYRLLLKNLEEIGDQAKKTAKVMLNYVRLNNNIVDRIREETELFEDFIKRLSHLHNIAFKAVLTEDYVKAEKCFIEYGLLRSLLIDSLRKCSKETRNIMRGYRSILDLVGDIVDLV